MPLLILTGCPTTTASVGNDAVACSAFEPIRWSDTDDMIRQVKEHNATSASLCDPIKGRTHEPNLEVSAILATNRRNGLLRAGHADAFGQRREV